jgi:hypothetical protein
MFSLEFHNNFSLYDVVSLIGNFVVLLRFITVVGVEEWVA